MLSLNYENINYVMTQILKLSCASFSYVNISYVLARVEDQTNKDFILLVILTKLGTPQLCLPYCIL